MSIAQRFALIFGAVYVLVGILGFIPPLITPASPAVAPGVPALGIPALGGYLLGLFAINWLHSVAHLLIGAAGLASYRSPVGARSYALALGVLYALLFLLGLILPNVFGLLPVGGPADIILHLLTALIAFGAYFATTQTEGRTA